jgi:hypothetical protein
MMQLNKIDLTERTIYEVIVSTYDKNNQPNAAPMGIRWCNSQKFIIRVYKSSLTYKNLCEHRCGVVNFTSDPEIFYRTALKEVNPGGKIPKTWFERSEKVSAPRLKFLDAQIDFTVKRIIKKKDPAVLLCAVKSVKLNKIVLRPYCRSIFVTIECIIHATRIRRHLLRGDLEEADRLINLIKHYHGIISRISPNSNNMRIVDDILSRIEKWKHKLAT